MFSAGKHKIAVRASVCFGYQPAVQSNTTRRKMRRWLSGLEEAYRAPPNGSFLQ